MTSGPATILVVDDNPTNRTLCRGFLAREGYRVLEACSGEEALEAISRDHPDLIVLDVMMPGIDGHEVARRVKASRLGRGTPIIMISALGSASDIVVGLEAGADEYLVKPITKAELVLRTQTMLRMRAERLALDRVDRQLDRIAAGLRETRRTKGCRELAANLVEILESIEQIESAAIWCVDPAAERLRRMAPRPSDDSPGLWTTRDALGSLLAGKIDHMLISAADPVVHDRTLNPDFTVAMFPLCGSRNVTGVLGAILETEATHPDARRLASLVSLFVSGGGVKMCRTEKECASGEIAPIALSIS